MLFRSCCDGTWNSADQERNGVPSPTDVVKLAYRVAKRDGATLQVIYYDQGVGTGNFFDRLTGGAFERGDEIYLFGFSHRAVPQWKSTRTSPGRRSSGRTIPSAAPRPFPSG